MSTELHLNVTTDEFQDSQHGFGTFLKNQQKELLTFYFRSVLITLGLIGNTLSIIVFSRPKMAVTSINLLLAALESSNLLLYLIYIPSFRRLFDYDYVISYESIIVEFGQSTVEPIAIFTSNWLAVSVGAWRLIGIKLPFRHDLRTRRKALTVIASVLSVSVIYIVTSAYYLGGIRQITYNITNQNTSEKRAFYALGYSDYAVKRKLTALMHGLMLPGTLAPIVCLLLVNLCLLKELWLARRIRLALRSAMLCEWDSFSQERRITITLTTYLFVYLLAYLPYVAFLTTHIYDRKLAESFRKFQIYATTFALLVCNASSFAFYYFMSRKFRQTFRGLFSRKAKMGSLRTITSRVNVRPNTNNMN